MPTVNCPSCGRALEVDGSYRDWTVRCPHCATEFVPADVAPAPFDSDSQDPRERPGRDNGEYEDRPRRRRNDPEREEWERQEAISLVHGPGTWLEVSGWLGGLLMIGAAVLQFVGAAIQANNPAAPRGQVEEEIVGGVISGMLAVPYAIVMIVGGRKMLELSSYNWAMTASVLGVASFMLFCCMCVCSFFPVGFGIWSLVTLNNPIVRRQFNRNRWEERNERDEQDRDD